MTGEVLPMPRRTDLKIAANLALPLEVVTEKLAFLGRTGSGKTYGAMKLAELMLAAGAQVGALDPVGVWRALRVPAEHGTSFDVVVFGGLYGDLPLEPTEHAGALIADLVVDRGLSFVLDVSQFIPAEQQRFVRAFADRFFHRKKSSPSAVHLFMEECQEFIPENPSGDEAKTLGVMQRLWKLGRNFGIGGSLISQRPQEIAKKALNMSGTLFAFQMTGPQERKAIKAWVADQGIATDIEGVLQKLRVGEPHVESPTFLEVSKTVTILPRVTADLSSTPKVGASTAAKRALTPIDVEQLKQQLAVTIEKAKADDPRELRKQIADLQRQLSVKKTAAPAPASTSDVPVLTDADLELLAKQRAYLEEVADRLRVGEEEIVRKAVELTSAAASYIVTNARAEIETRRAEFLHSIEHAKFATVLDKIASAAPATPHRHALTTSSKALEVRDHGPRPPMRVSRPASPGKTAASLPKGEVATLTVAAQYPEGATREQVSILTGYKRSSRDTYIQRLREHGFLEIRQGLIVATDAGFTALGPDFEPLPTGAELRRHWLERLPEGERRVLEVVIKAHPRAVARDDIDSATGYKRSSRDTYLQRLGMRQLVESVGRGEVRASETLFG